MKDRNKYDEINSNFTLLRIDIHLKATSYITTFYCSEGFF